MVWWKFPRLVADKNELGGTCFQGIGCTAPAFPAPVAPRPVIQPDIGVHDGAPVTGIPEENPLMSARIRSDSRRRGRNVIFVLVILAVVANVILVSRYLRYKEETNRLRAGMTKAQRERVDAVVAAEQHRLRVELGLVRRQARGDRQLHLAVNVDSGHMILERDGVIMREMPVRLGPERFRGPQGDSAIQVQALGQRTVERVLTERDTWEVPATVFADRGIPAPESRRVRGALGGNAILLNDGSVVYAVPDSGPLADTSYVLPGSIQVAAADLKALAASIRPGMAVYFYR